MRFSTAAITLASVFSMAEAKINGISVPSTIKPGDGFNMVIESSNYIQAVYDVAIAVGYAPGKGFPGDLGTPIGSYYLGPEQSNQLHNFNKWVTMPSSATKGQAVISASLMSLWGAAAGPGLSNYNVTVTIGDSTSTTYVSSSA